MKGKSYKLSVVDSGLIIKFAAPSRVPVPDDRFDFLCEHHNPARYGIKTDYFMS